jgi:phosphatidylserine decarboxylase
MLRPRISEPYVIEHPLVRDLSLNVWRLFADLNLEEAKKTRFRSMHDCF